MEKTFEWTRGFETGLTDVDAQHRQLVDIINILGDRLAKHFDIDTAEADGLYQQLKDYALYHFREEEGLMARAGLDPRHQTQHQAQHHYFVSEVERLYRDFSPADAEAGHSLLEFLTSWLAYHILGMDHSMARQMENLRTGMTPEEAMLAEEEEREGATEPLLAALHGLFEEVAERNRQLEALNENLEQRVTARTEELTLTVARLEAEKAQSQRLGEELTRANRHLEEMAMTDVLTGLPNRRHAMAVLDRRWRESTEQGSSLAAIMIDADGFKPINDTYGHDAGDEVLVKLAKELVAAVRSDDVVCRMGGDEFLIICPDTPLAGAEKVAADTWRRVGALRVPVGDGEWQGSISLGVAALRPDMHGVADLLKNADDAVYAAKDAGRNCVRTAA